MSYTRYLRNPWVKHALKLGFSVGVVIYLILRVDVSGVLESFQNATIEGVLLSTILVVVGVVFFQALEIHWSMRPSGRISVLNLSKINLGLMFYVLFMPAGLTFVIRWSKYRRAGYDGYDSFALVGFHKILQLTVACLVSFGALVYARESLGRYGDELAAIVGISGIVLLVALTLLISGVGVSVAGGIGRLFGVQNTANGSGLKARIASKVSSLGKKAGDAFLSFRELNFYSVVLVVVFACLQHLFIVLSSWVIVVMIDPNATLLAVAFVRSIVVILLMAPVSVGGLGVRELAFFTLFPLFGVASESALTASLILFGVQLIVSAIGAVVELFEHFGPRPAA